MDVMYAVFAGAKNCLLQLLKKVTRTQAKRCETSVEFKILRRFYKKLDVPFGEHTALRSTPGKS